MDNIDLTQLTGHGLSTSALLAAWLGLFPTVSAVLGTTAAFIWYSIQIYESDFVQKRLKNRRRRKMQRLQTEIDELKKHVTD